MIGAAPLIYTFSTPTEYLQEYIDEYGSRGYVILGAYKTRGVLPDEALIIMHLEKEHPDYIQRSADELLLESIGEMPWYAKEFLNR